MLRASLERSLQIPGIPRKGRQKIYLSHPRQGSSTLPILILLLHVFFPVVLSQNEPLSCPEESFDGATWPKTDVDTDTPKQASSTPLCLSENWSLVTRSCEPEYEGGPGRWVPYHPPSCARLQPTYDNVDKCPPPFRNLTRGPVCAHLGNSGSWDRAINTCFLSGTSRSVLDLDKTSFNAVLEYLRSKLWSGSGRNTGESSKYAVRSEIRSVWLDGRRNKALTPIVRKLPGDFQRMGVLWAELANATVPWAAGEPSLSSEKQCLSMDVPRFGSPSLRMEHCFSKRPAACVFVPTKVESSLLTRLTCPEGYVTSIYQGEQHRCFRIIREGVGTTNNGGAQISPADRCSSSGDTLMRLSSAHVNAIFIELAQMNGLKSQDKCLIGLSRKENRFVWRKEEEEDDEEEVDYVNWDVRTDFEKGEVGVARGDGRWELITCRETLSVGWVACERPAQVPPRARLTLRLHPPSGRLLLSVYSGEGLWRYGGSEPVACFSDGHFGLARRLELGPPVRDGKWSLHNLRLVSPDLYPGLVLSGLHKTVFVLPTSPGEVGRYWCEARRVIGLRPLSTDRVWNANTEKGTFVFSLALEAVGVCSGDLGIRDCEPTFGSKHYEVAVDLRERMRLRQGSIKPVRILSVTNGNLCLLMRVAIKMQYAEDETTSESMMEYGTYLRLMALVWNTVMSSGGKYEFLWLRSTRGCIQSYSRTDGPNGLTELHWDACPLGYSAVSREICLQAPNGSVPVIRTCRGDFMFGGIWDPPSGSCSELSPPDLTTSLHALMLEARSGGNPRKILRRASELSSNPSLLSSADIHFLAMTMRGVAASAATLRADEDLGIVTSVVDHVMRARHENVSLSQRLLNSTNVLLDAMDDILGEMILGESIGERYMEEKDSDMDGAARIHRIGGVYAAVTSQVVVQVSDVSSGNNVTGVALVRKSVSSDYALGHKSESDDSDNHISGFKRYSLLPLTSEQTLESLAELQPEVAVLLPLEMLPGGDTYVTGEGNTSTPTRVVTTIFYSDLPFRRAEGGSIVSLDSDEDDDELDDVEDDDDDDDDDDEVYGEQVNSRVINVWTPGLGPDLPAPIPILFRPLRPVEAGFGRQCAHWDFSASSWGGGWASDGCFFAGTTSTGMDVCICTHLTHFAELLYPFSSDSSVMLSHFTRVLDIISILGCVLSLLGIAGIVATAIAFRRWRHRLGSKVLLNLTAAIGLEMMLFLAVNSSSFSPDDVVWCMTLGCALHYSVIATFCWMLVAAALQYLRFVRILGDYRPPRFLLKTSLFAWGFPLLPIVLVLSIDSNPYGVDIYDANMSLPVSDDFSFCYPTGLSLSLGVLLPVVLVVAANLCIYILILRSILASSAAFRKSPGETYGSTTKNNTSPNGATNGVSSKTAGRSIRGEYEQRKMAARHLRLACLLFFLLGLSWIFGILTRVIRLSVFSYLFCATATVQGFVLFIFYVVGDPNTRQLWAIRLSKMVSHFKIRCGSCGRKSLPCKCCENPSPHSVDEDPSYISSAAEISCYQNTKTTTLSE